MYDKILFALKQPGATTNDLFEFNHCIDWAQQNDITDIAGINTGGQFLGSCYNSRNGFFIILEIPQMLFTERTLIGGDALTVIGIITVF